MNANVWFLSISGMQKCVRRGLPDQAVILARIAWDQNPRALYGRCFTVAFEECGRSASIMTQVANFKGGPAAWDEIEEFVRLMARPNSTFKCNETVAMMLWLEEKSKEAPEDIQRIADLWESYRFASYDELEYPEEAEWLINTCERGYSLDKEHLSIGIPYLWMKDMACDYEIIVDDCPVGDLWRDLIPYSAFDGHTRVGSFALSLYARRFPVPELKNREDWKAFVFKHEGMLIRNRKTMKQPLRFMTNEHINTIKIGPEAINWTRMNEGREFVMERQFPDEVKYILNAAKKYRKVSV